MRQIEKSQIEKSKDKEGAIMERFRISLNLLATAVLASIFPITIQVWGLEIVRRMLDVFFARHS